MREPFRHGAPPTVTVRGRAGCRNCGRRVFKNNRVGICHKCQRQSRATRERRGFHSAQNPWLMGVRGRGRHRLDSLLSLWERSERIRIYAERAAAELPLFEREVTSGP